MITHEEVVLLVKKNPNDMKLGSKIRQLYLYDSENPYRHEDNMPDMPAQQTITEGTSVTSLDSAMEEAHSILEDENRFPGTKKTDYTIHGYDANGSPVEEEIDTTTAYTRNPHPRTGI